MQIYYDFSGYSDMAIGLGRCFGFHFEENFCYPYMAASVTEFWKKWHISLTNWFRDYVYIPLGGNRVSSQRHTRNLLFVWLLTGLWHGANWTFILWGLVYFCIQMIEKYAFKKKAIKGFIGHFYTIVVIMLCWVLFRSSTIHNALCYIGRMFFVKAVFFDEASLMYIRSCWKLFIVAIAGCFPVKSILKQIVDFESNMFYRVIRGLFLIVVFLLSILCTINGAYSPFVYFNF